MGINLFQICMIWINFGPGKSLATILSRPFPFLWGCSHKFTDSVHQTFQTIHWSIQKECPLLYSLNMSKADRYWCIRLHWCVPLHIVPFSISSPIPIVMVFRINKSPSLPLELSSKTMISLLNITFNMKKISKMDINL